jgi:hypothetical protein
MDCSKEGNELMTKQPQLHEVLAVEGDLSAVLSRVLAEAVNTFAKKPDTFRGQTRTVEMFDEGRQGENDTDTKSVNSTVPDKLSYVGGHAARYYDAMLQKERTNQEARADLVVNFEGEELLIEGLPATFLLGLETRLKALRELIEAVPTLDPSLSWSLDPEMGKGIFVSQPKSSLKTEKTVQSKVLYDATKEHPAQIEKWSEDRPVGKITTTQRSGMISVSEKSRLLGRLDAVLRGVKRARQRANTVEIVKVHAGQRLMEFLLG